MQYLCQCFGLRVITVVKILSTVRLMYPLSLFLLPFPPLSFIVCHCHILFLLQLPLPYLTFSNLSPTSFHYFIIIVQLGTGLPDGPPPGGEGR